MKPKVIFIHPLKTGGTSVRYMLLKEYGYERIAPVPMGEAIRSEQDYPTMGEHPLMYQRRITPDMVQGYDVAMSHYDWGIVGRLPDWSIITVLRDPVEQIRSLYEYMIVRPHLFPDAAHMSALGFAYWVQSKYAQPYLNNQTLFLSGHHVNSCDVALKHLDDPRLEVGVLEHFDETVQRWNKRFGWSMTIEHRNKAENSMVMDANTRNLVQALQKDDMILWAEASARFGENS